MMVAIEAAVTADKGDLVIDRTAAAPPIVRVTGLSEEGISRLVSAIVRATDKAVTEVPNAAEHLICLLPPLSRVIEGLPTMPMPGAHSFERWDPSIARFERVPDAHSSGAFRLSGFVRAYIYRRPDDLHSMTAMLGDRRIVKYAAALDSKHSLLGYDGSAQVLYVPLGADFPETLRPQQRWHRVVRRRRTRRNIYLPIPECPACAGWPADRPSHVVTKRSTVTTTNPYKVYSEIKDTYLRYIETAFWLRSDELMRERRDLLANTDVLFTDVLLEPVLPYDANVELATVTQRLGLDHRVGEIVGAALFGEFTGPEDSNPAAHSPSPSLGAIDAIRLFSGS